jgi:hypothetical protein
MKTGNWGYIANQAGGFLGFWWNFLDTNECQIHIQLRQEELCFKITVLDESKDSYSSLRNEWSQKIVQSGKVKQLDIKKPKRFGQGKYMTVAVLSQDYRLTGNNQLIRMEDTIQYLRKMEKVLNDAIAKDLVI